jgi:hypothetical protein
MLVTHGGRAASTGRWVRCRVTVLFTVGDGAVQTQKVSAGGHMGGRIAAVLEGGWRGQGGLRAIVCSARVGATGTRRGEARAVAGQCTQVTTPSRLTRHCSEVCNITDTSMRDAGRRAARAWTASAQRLGPTHCLDPPPRHPSGAPGIVVKSCGLTRLVLLRRGVPGAALARYTVQNHKPRFGRRTGPCQTASRTRRAARSAAAPMVCKWIQAV